MLPQVRINNTNFRHCQSISNQVWAQEAWQFTVKEKEALEEAAQGPGDPTEVKGGQRPKQRAAGLPNRTPLGYLTCDKTQVQFSQSNDVCIEP